MGKSLEVSSDGIPFGRFMKALIQVPKDEIDKALQTDKKKRSKKPRRSGAIPHDAR
jgi:hypothetical protein